MSCKRVSLSTGAMLGNLDEVCRDFREKRKSISGLLSWTQRALILSLRAIWNFGKGTGLS